MYNFPFGMTREKKEEHEQREEGRTIRFPIIPYIA